jgi:hypothetical protein
MPREVDPKRTRKALRQVRKLAALQDAAMLAAGETPPDYSGWEKEFLSEVEARLDKYGSAFNDLGKGRPDEALSNLQAQKLREIAKKASGGKSEPTDKPRSSFKAKKKPQPSFGRQLHEDDDS